MTSQPNTPPSIFGRDYHSFSDAFKPRQPISYLIQDLIQTGSFSCFYGYPGSLKSMVVMDMAMAVATGSPFLPTESNAQNGTISTGGKQTKKSSVLWIDLDNGKDVTEERIRAFAEAYKADRTTTQLDYLSYPQTPIKANNTTLMSQISNELKTKPNKPDWIIIDTLLRVAGVSDENSSEMDLVMANLHRLAEDLNAAITIIHHSKKNNSKTSRPEDALRGHSSISGGLDTVFYVARESKTDMITVTVQKARRKPPQPFAAVYNFVENPQGDLFTNRFYNVAPGCVPNSQAIKLQAVKTEIEKLLKNHPKGLKQSDILQKITGANSTVLAQLNNMVSSGMISETSIGRAKIYVWAMP